MKKVITQIFLNREYANIKKSPVYILTSPSGNVKITHLLALTSDMKLLFDDSGIDVEEATIERDVNEKNLKIGKVKVNRIAPDTLEYSSDSEDEAKRKYLDLKAELPEYRFLGHECETKNGTPCTHFRSQKKLSDTER